MKIASFVVCLSALVASGSAAAAMQAKPLAYEVDGRKMQSVLVYDDAGAKRPGLLLVPNWMGVTDIQIEKAKKIAGKDFVVLVADVYGVDARPANPDEAGKATQSMYADRKILRARINAALAQLKGQLGHAPLDGKHYAAIGFCFGGAVALELARSGADIAAVVTFHANLATDDTSLAKNFKGKVLAMNGGDDKYVPAEQIATFQKEMADAGLDWQFVNFGGAVHCFAEIDEKGQIPGCLYNERAARRSNALMRSFLSETFAD